MENIKLIDNWLDTAQLVCTKTDGRTKYHFSKFTFLPKFTLKVFCPELALQKAKYNQVNLEILINKLNNSYNPKNPEKIKQKEDALKSAKNYSQSVNKLLEHLRKVFFRT